MDRRGRGQSGGAVRVRRAGGVVDAAGRQADRAADERSLWVGVMRRLADPVLNNLANETLRLRMPVEQAPGADRRSVTHLEALGRLMAGIGPWIELGGGASAEGGLRAGYADLARRALDRAVDPASPDFLNFSRDRQPVVDAAFLAQGLLRARHQVLETLEARTVRNLVAALESTRSITPSFSNWLMFSATIEAALAALGARPDLMRVDYALRQHDEWYKGDGAPRDGPAFHWDYYNSFVIHPMLLDVLDVFREKQPAWKDLAGRVETRARRYAAVLESLGGPAGPYPRVGGSPGYRSRAFTLLRQPPWRARRPQ